MTGFDWNGRRVLVTGAGGFIGSHLVEALAARHASVRALLKYNSGHYEGSIGFVDPAVLERVDLQFGDVRDPAAVRELLDGVDTVFHLAALISIPYSYAHPAEVVETNVGGTLHVLLAARERGLRRVVLTSTSEVYGTAQRAPIDEEHPLNPQSPYAATKIAADMLGLSFQKAYGLPVSIVRPFNTYGPRQSARAIIPTIITQALTQAQLRLGALDPRRDFTFVEDTVEGFLAAAATDRTVGEIVNFGAGRSISVGELAQLVLDLAGRRVPVVTDEARLRPAASEVRELCADSRRARELTGWEPLVPLREGLQRTIAWIGDHLDAYAPGVYRT
jgi:dTDP-glucose 4,6-dehydratase